MKQLMIVGMALLMVAVGKICFPERIESGAAPSDAGPINVPAAAIDTLHATGSIESTSAKKDSAEVRPAHPKPAYKMTDFHSALNANPHMASSGHRSL